MSRIFGLPFIEFKSIFNVRSLLRWHGPFPQACERLGAHFVLATFQGRERLEAHPSALEKFSADQTSQNMFEAWLKHTLGIAVTALESKDSGSLTIIGDEEIPEQLRPLTAPAQCSSNTAMVKLGENTTNITTLIGYLQEMQELAADTKIELDEEVVSSQLQEMGFEPVPGPVGSYTNDVNVLVAQFWLNQMAHGYKGYSIFSAFYPHEHDHFLQLMAECLIPQEIKMLKDDPQNSLERLIAILEAKRSKLAPGQTFDGIKTDCHESGVPLASFAITAEAFPMLGIRVDRSWGNVFYWLNGEERLKHLERRLYSYANDDRNFSLNAPRPETDLLRRLREWTFFSAQDVLVLVEEILGIRRSLPPAESPILFDAPLLIDGTSKK
jgi:hypothetical protein